MHRLRPMGLVPTDLRPTARRRMAAHVASEEAWGAASVADAAAADAVADAGRPGSNAAGGQRLKAARRQIVTCSRRCSSCQAEMEQDLVGWVP